MNDGGKSKSNGSEKDGPQRLSDADEFEGAQMADGAPNPATNDALSFAKAEAEKFKNEYLYQRAEFENFKKQAVKERSDLRKYGSERLVSDLLGVLDILETALATEVTPENLATWRKGVDMTAGELRRVLTSHGVTEIPSKGLPFDPAHHEALSSEETNESQPGTVTQVFKKPYKLHDRVVRPGQVIVAKQSSK